MSDLISRKAAIEQVERRMTLMIGDKGVSPESFINFLRNRPAVDAEPVRHGRWIEEEPAVYKCSECGFIFTSGDSIKMFAYCRCGAKMDGERDE